MFYDRALLWCWQSQPLYWHFNTSWSYYRHSPFSVSYWHFYQFWYTLILHYLSPSSFTLSCPTDFRLYAFQCCWPWSKYTCFIKYVNNGNVNSTLRWFEYDIYWYPNNRFLRFSREFTRCKLCTFTERRPPDIIVLWNQVSITFYFSITLLIFKVCTEFCPKHCVIIDEYESTRGRNKF